MTTITRSLWKDRFSSASKAITEEKVGLSTSFIVAAGFASLTGPGVGATVGAVVACGAILIKLFGWEKISWPLLGMAVLYTGATHVSLNMGSNSSTFNEKLNEVLSIKEEGAIRAPYETTAIDFFGAWGTKTVTEGQLTRVCQTKNFTLISLGEGEPLLAFPSNVKRPATKEMGTTTITEKMLAACRR